MTPSQFMNRRIVRVFLFACLTFVLAGAQSLLAGSDMPGDEIASDTLLNLSLDELLNMDVTMVAARPTVQSEAPAIVTIITREDIALSGARGLMDVLRTVPGFDFGVDIWNVVGVGFRGLWGHEGKILLTVDGMGFNEFMYGNVPYGNHFPLELVERIEIIRGPGSARFGNFAELAVINVITMTGAGIPGARVSSTTGFFDSGFNRENLTAKYGTSLDTDGYLGVSLSGNLAHRSDKNYTDQAGASWNMHNDSSLKTGSAILNLRKGGLSGGFIYDQYQTSGRDGYGDVLNSALKPGFISYLGRLSYESAVTDELKVTGGFKASIQQPWRITTVPVTDPTYYDPTVQVYNVSLNALWEPLSWASTQFGVEYEHQLARYGSNDLQQQYTFPGGAQQIDFNRYAIYNEWLLETSLVNITAGLRFEKNSDYNPAVVPRLSLTRSFGDTSTKLLYNRAFRAPSIEQTSSGLKTGNKLQTETSDVLELEVSHRFDSRNHASVNLFNIIMDNPIVFQYDLVKNLDTYQNQGRVGSRGVEAEYRFRDDWGHLALRYAFYQATAQGSPYYRVPENDSVFLGFPAHKVTLDANYKLTRNLNLNSTMIFISDRYGYDHVDATTNQPVVKRYNPELVANLYLLYKNAFRQGLDVGFGIYDLLDTTHTFIQPYNGGHAPLPGPGREYLLRVSYAFGS
jgi:outer membrane receptor for ferrienterochelin and colicins